MKPTEAIQVGDLLKAMMESDGNSDEFFRQKVCYLWADVVGPVINRATIRCHVDGSVLHVYITSGPIKSELALMSARLVNDLNKACGRPILTKIAIH